MSIGDASTPATPAWLDAVAAVRLLAADTAAPPLLADAQMEVLLRLNGATANDVDVPARVLRLAAADALDIVASSEALVSKVIKTQDLSTDGAKVAAELRARAATLRELVYTSEDAGVVEVVEVFHGHRPGYGWGW